MKLRRLFTDDRAVSPVVGVVLMVGITVVLAGVVGTFVMGIGQKAKRTTPQAEFTFDYDGSNEQLTIAHDDGATFDGGNTDDLTVHAHDESAEWSGEVSAGDEFVVDNDGVPDPPDLDLASPLSSGDTVRIIWAGTGDRTSVVGKFTIP